MGALTLHQGGGEDAHVDRSARQHQELRTHLERQAERRSCSRSALPEAGAIYVMDRGYVDFARLYVLHQLAPSSSPVQSRTWMSTASTRRRQSGDRYHCRPDYRLDGYSTAKTIRSSALRPLRMLHREKGWFLTNHFTLPAALIYDLYKRRWQVELFFKWIKQHLRIKQFYALGQRVGRKLVAFLYVLLPLSETSAGGLAYTFSRFSRHPLQKSDVPEFPERTPLSKTAPQ